MKKLIYFLMIPAVVLLFANCDSSGGADPAEELYGKTWQTNCLESVSSSGTYQVTMTFFAGGGFQRVENYHDDPACEGGAETTINIDKTFTWVEETTDPGVKKLTYIDENDNPVYVLYTLESDTTLNFAEDDSAYPADLTGAVDFTGVAVP